MTADMWTYSPPRVRVIYPHAGQMSLIQRSADDINYWINVSTLVGFQEISSVVISADSGITISESLINTSALTDTQGRVHRIGRVLGLGVSGGSIGETYKVSAAMTLESLEVVNLVLYIGII